MGPGRLNTLEKLFPCSLHCYSSQGNSQVIATPEEIKILYPVSLPSLVPQPPFYKTNRSSPATVIHIWPSSELMGQEWNRKYFVPILQLERLKLRKVRSPSSHQNPGSRVQYFFESCWINECTYHSNPHISPFLCRRGSRPYSPAPLVGTLLGDSFQNSIHICQAVCVIQYGH